MPYTVKHDATGCPPSRPWAVIGPSGKKGCHTSRAKAERQQRALYANDPDAAVTDGHAGNTFAPFDAALFDGVISEEEYTRLTAAGVTVTLAEDTGDELAPVPWMGIVCFEGLAAEDNTELPRIMLPDSLAWRELPFSLMAQTVTADGHDGAFLAGRVDALWREPYDDGVTAIWGAGDFTTPRGISEIAPRVDDGTMTGVSVDLAGAHWAVVDRETLSFIDSSDAEKLATAMFDGQHYAGLVEGVIGAITLCPLQAMAPARIALAASAAERSTFVISGEVALEEAEALTASAAGLAPLDPPRDWFQDPRLPEPTPLTVTDDGQVYGHLALWGTCHTGFRNECVLAPRSRTGYAEFHLGEIATAEGDRVPVGKLTVNLPHAPTTQGYAVEKVRAHYDDARSVGAFVRAGEDRHGIWVAGAVRSDAPAEVVRDMMANPPSGDWRRGELQGALCVPIPGFPVRRATLVASADGMEVESLIIGGYIDDELALDEDCGCLEDFVERMHALALMADGGIAALVR